MRKQKLSQSVKADFSIADLATLDALADLCFVTRAEMIRQCVKFSGNAVRRKYIRDFVKKAKHMPSPFDDPVFDPPPKNTEEFEERLLDKLLALDSPKKAKKKNICADKGKHGYSLHDFNLSVDQSDA